MILSMTGYGKAVLNFTDKKVNIEIKALNSKTLDLTTKIASPYREMEMEIRKLLTTNLLRGKIDFSLWIEKDENHNPDNINVALIRKYYHQLTDISQQTGIPLPQDWYHILLRMPEVITTAGVHEVTEQEKQTIMQGITQATQELYDFRKQEGQNLEKTFREKVQNIQQLLYQIESFEGERITRIKEKISEGLKKIAFADYDKNRMEQELIYYIEKLDINEEKQRLQNHINYFLETMDEPQGQGKKLGFIAQEIGREINTTGSKSNHAEMQKIVVKMKDELEQIKEQVLNVL